MEARARNVAKGAARVVLSGLALYIVFQQVDAAQLISIFRTTSFPWLLLALVLYASSKAISSLRLNRYFAANGITLTDHQNLKLYWLCMFYNLFLPGGIGGDAYKVWLLHKDHNAPAGKALQAVLFDRVSGLFILGFLAALMAWISFPEMPWRLAMLLLAVLALLSLLAAHYLFAASLLKVITITTVLSFAVQITQILCAWSLLKALAVTDQTGAYLSIFLVSSAVAVLPISIGGVGIRELVFVTAANYAPVSAETSVAFSLLFFLVTAASSLPGAFVTLPQPGKNLS